MDSNKSDSRLNEKKYPRKEFSGKVCSRLTKYIISCFGKVWNNLFSFLFEPNSLSEVSNFYDVREQYFNDEKYDSVSRDITHYYDQQDILLNLEPKEELYFPLPFRNYNLELRGKLSAPEQLNKNSFKKVGNPTETLNINSDDSKALEQNMILRNDTKNEMETSETETKRDQNSHSSHELNSNIFCMCNLSSSVSSNAEHSCSLQSLISSENDYDMKCEEKRHNNDVSYTYEKSSANTSFSESFHSDVADMDVNICLFDKFGDFQESQTGINYSDQKAEIHPSAKYLNLVQKVHETYFKSCPEKFCYNTDSTNTSSAQNDEKHLTNNVISNILNLSDSFDHKILNNVCTSMESGNEISKPEKINGESFYSADACNVDISEDNVLHENASDNISKLCYPVPNFDKEVHNKGCFGTEHDTNYSVTECDQNCLKSGRTLYFSSIRQCFINYFNIQDALIRSTLNPKFDQMLFTKLEENSEHSCGIDNSILAMNSKVKQAKIKKKNNADAVTIRALKDAGDKSCARIISNASNERHNQQTFDTFPITNIRIKEELFKAKDKIEMSKKAIPPFTMEGLEKRERNYNYGRIPNGDCITNDSQGENSYESEKKGISWSNQEHLSKNLTDVSDTPISTIRDLENECDVLGLFKTPPNSAIYRKKLDENDVINSTNAMTYKHQHRFYIPERDNDKLKSMHNSKHFNNMNKVRDLNTSVETENKMWDDEQLPIKKRKIYNIMKINCELNGDIHKNGSFDYLTNNINYNSENQTALDPYSDETTIDKKKCESRNCASEPFGNEICLSKARYSKRKIANDNNKNASKDYRKCYKGTCERGVQANFRNYSEHFITDSIDKQDKFLRSVNEQENKMDFIKSSTSQNCANNSERINNVSFFEEKNTPYEIRKKIRFSSNTSRNSQMTTQKWSKIQMDLQHSPKNTKIYATPVVIKQCITKNVSEIKNFDTLVGNLTEKSENQVEKNISKFSAENRIRKTSEKISPTDLQNFVPDFLKEHSDFLNPTECAELRRRKQSTTIEIPYSGNVVRIENYKIVKSSERECKNCQNVSRRTKTKLHSQSDPKRSCMHQSRKDKNKCVRTEIKGKKILPRKNFLINKKRKEKGDSESKQSLKRNKKELKLIPNLIMPSHLNTFNSHHGRSLKYEEFIKHKYHTVLAIPEIKPSYRWCIEAEEDPSSKNEEVPQISTAECGTRIKSKESLSIKPRTRKRRLEMDDVAYWKSKYARTFCADNIALDDLLLKSSRKSIEKAVKYAQFKSLT